MRPSALVTVGRHCCWVVVVLLVLSGCSPVHRFQYQYTMTAPAGGSEGVETAQARLHLVPLPEPGVLTLTVANKGTEPLRIVWEQTYYLDPRGRRRPASDDQTPYGALLQQWPVATTPIAPGETRRLTVRPGRRPVYNPFTVSRYAGGEVVLSSAPRPLFPASGKREAMGKAYEGQEFQFLLALQLGTEVVHYAFTFRITSVQVQ